MTDAALCAKAVRKELKEVYPNTKWSVLCENFSMGNGVAVHYYEGPDKIEVSLLLRKYQYGESNGLTDSYDMTNVRKDIPQVKFVTVSKHIRKDSTC